MPFKSVREVEQRLANSAPLTEEDIRECIPWLPTLGSGAMRRFETEVPLAGLLAVRQFEKSSSKQGKLNLVLNFALLVLAVVAVFIALKSYRAAVDSGKEQEAVLRQVAGSLESARRIFEEQWSWQLEKEGRMPRMTASLRAYPPMTKEVELSGQPVFVEVKHTLVKLFFTFRNVGDAPLDKPVYIVTAQPRDVVVLTCGGQFPQGQPMSTPDVCRFDDPHAIYPIGQSKITRTFEVGLTAVRDLKRVDVELKLAGENISTRVYRVHLKINLPAEAR